MSHVGSDVGVSSLKITPSLNSVDPWFFTAAIASMRVIKIIILVINVEIGSARTKLIT